MSYYRVIPRDLFNEAKLLKCLGLLSLAVHEGFPSPVALAFNHDDPVEGFPVAQTPEDGSLVCPSLRLLVGNGPPKPVVLYTQLNCRDEYPLMFGAVDPECPEDARVFGDDGRPSPEFLDFLLYVDAWEESTS